MPTIRPRDLALPLCIVAVSFLLSGQTPGTKPAANPGKTTTTAPAGKIVPWKQIDTLVEEQKFEAAATEVEKRLEAAKASRDETEWTRALIRLVQLRTGLHGYETSVRFLREQPWPSSASQQVVLHLFYAESLLNYLNMYSYEIHQRETISSVAEVPGKAPPVEWDPLESTCRHASLSIL